MIKEVIAEGQDIFDIAIAKHGSVEGVFLLLTDNPALTLDSDMSPGNVVKIASASPDPLSETDFIFSASRPSTIELDYATEGMDLYDYALRNYGSVQGIFDLLKDNADVIDNLNVDLTPGAAIKIDTEAIVEISADAIMFPASSKVIFNDVHCEGQDLFDLSIAKYGSVEGIFNLIEDNPGVIDDQLVSLTPGTIYKYDKTKVVDETTYSYLVNARKDINTGALEGVEFWGIEFDFVVQ
jgi:hypothetical protein